jgi:hypothetical protein
MRPGQLPSYPGSSDADRRDYGDGGKTLRNRRSGDRLAGTAAGEAGEAGCPPAMSATPEAVEQGHGGDRRERRRYGSEVALSHVDQRLELAAAGAILQMGAQLPPAQPSAVLGRQRTAYRVTRHVAAFRHLVKGCAGLEDELLCGGGGRTERRSDLAVVETAQLAHHKRGPLPVVQLPEVGYELSQALPCICVGSPSSDIDCLLETGGGRAPAQQRDGFVVGNPE